jgi:hypothetical protein
MALSSTMLTFNKNGTDTLGEMLPMVFPEDNDDGAKGYVFLKKQECSEVHWEVRGQHSEGRVHDIS